MKANKAAAMLVSQLIGDYRVIDQKAESIDDLMKALGKPASTIRGHLRRQIRAGLIEQVYKRDGNDKVVKAYRIKK